MLQSSVAALMSGLDTNSKLYSGLSRIAAGMGAGAAPAPVSGPQPAPAAPGGWQADRVAAMRARFSRPGSAARMPALAPRRSSPMVAKPAPVAAAPVEQAPVSPAAQDVINYSQAWEQSPGY